jgi:hypothetical protein
MSALKLFEQNSLSLKLIPISIRELFLLTRAPCDLYAFVDGLFQIVLKKNVNLNQVVFKNLIDSNQWKLFVTSEEKQNINFLLQEELQKSARSLSMGDIQKNVAHQTNLLTITLSYVYNDPLNDTTLKLQYQSVKNLGGVLIQNIDLLKEFYEDYQRQKQFFLLAQPLLTSFLYLGFLENLKIFSSKDLEQLFVTSYFKDLGMSFLPQDIFTKNELTHEEKELLQDHPKHSVDILRNRLPFQQNQLNIIANHHCLNPYNDLALSGPKTDDNFIIGVETVFMGLIDTIVAATTPRPYRDPVSLYVILDKLKQPVLKSYAAEFKVLVYFLRRFYNQ